MKVKYNRIIFHIDVNSAFLSWSAADRIEKGDLIDLRKIPSVIGGDESNRRGVVLAKSIPAKRYGIVTGESLFSARKKYPELIVVKPSFELYEQCSSKMMNTLKEYTPLIEKFSIDECFLDVTSHYRYSINPVDLAVKIKDRVKRELGFTVNVGISSNKLLAKMASDFKKPDKVHTLYKHEIKDKMWPLAVGELFMVGKKTVPKLNNLNIYTIGDLAKYDLDILIEKFKSKGIMMWRFANGIDEAKVGAVSEMKGISNSITLASDIVNREKAHEIISSLCESTSARLRKLKKCCLCITVSIRSGDFSDYSHQKKLNTASDCTDKIKIVAKELFDEIWKGEPIRLIGIALTNLCSEQVQQISLFDSNYDKAEKQRKLDKTIDYLKDKYGEKSIVRSANLCKIYSRK